MILWVLDRAWWWIWRILITIACLETLRHLLSESGITLRPETLYPAALCVLLGTRIWAPWR